jgi:L-lysine exporter family protein LysE/ArgO
MTADALLSPALTASAIKFYGWSLAGVILSRRFDRPIYRKRMDAIAGLVLIPAALLLAANILHGA